MNGIAVDTFEAFESLTEISDLKSPALQIDAEIIRNPSFGTKYSKLNQEYLAVRNPVPPRLNRLILESSFKLRMDYLESLDRELEFYHKANVKKILLDFDLPGVLYDEGKRSLLSTIAAAAKGTAAKENIEIELLFRLPFNDMEDFMVQAAFFRQQHMSGLNYAVDLHIHEAGFDIESLDELLLPVRYDIGTLNFVYDAALGNKINPHNLQKIMDLLITKGANCNFFLCPSGNINLQTIVGDLRQWDDMH